MQTLQFKPGHYVTNDAENLITRIASIKNDNLTFNCSCSKNEQGIIISRSKLPINGFRHSSETEIQHFTSLLKSTGFKFSKTYNVRKPIRYTLGWLEQVHNSNFNHVTTLDPTADNEFIHSIETIKVSDETRTLSSLMIKEAFNKSNKKEQLASLKYAIDTLSEELGMLIP